MKKSLLALAVLGAFAGAASAQSSVTLWGVVDESINNVKNGNSNTTVLAANQLNSNRLGFRGIEDLGNGLKAGFWLEAGMDNGTGYAGGGSGNVAAGDSNSAQLFNRRSTVSMIHDKFGEVRLGRDYDPSFWNTVYDDVNGANGLGQGLNLISSLGSGATTIARANNSMGYFLPGGIGGIYGQAMYALGQTPAGQSNKYYGGRIGWGAGPFDVNGAYGETHTENPGNFTMWNVGGSWDFGVAKIYGFYNENKWNDLKQEVYEISASVPIGQLELRAVYGHEAAKGSPLVAVPCQPIAGVTCPNLSTDGNDADLYSIEGVYNLSKRTAIYATAAQIKNKNKAAFNVLPGTVVDSALIGGKSTGYNLGLRHSF
jgi:predicted porin